MTIHLVYNSSCAISKRLRSYHPRLFSLLKLSSIPSPTTIPAFPIPYFHSNPNFKSFHTLKFPFKAPVPLERSFQYRNLIIQAGSDSTMDDDSDDEEEEKKKQASKVKTKPKDAKDIKPFFDPFNKKPVIQEPDDPQNLQEIFHNMREDNLVQEAVKMFDGLSKDGYTYEAMRLFGVLKDNGKMPEVVAHTAVVEAYCKAGKMKDGLKNFTRMQAAGVKPNSYSYSVLIQGLCQAGMLEDAGKYTLEMLNDGWNPNAATYVMLVDSYLRAKKENEMRQLLVKLKDKGFVADDKAARNHMNKMGRFNRGVMDLLFGKYK